MVIGSSEVSMSSGRAYSRRAKDRSSVSSWGEVLGATTTPTARESRTVTQREETTQVVELYNTYSKNGRPVVESGFVMEETSEMKTQETVSKTTLPEEADTVMRSAVGKALFVRVFASGSGSSETTMTLQQFFSLLIHRRREAFERFLENFRIGMQGSLAGSRTVSVGYEGDSTVTYLASGRKLEVSRNSSEWETESAESERTDFAASGKVVTGDGRQIDFDLSLGLKRDHFSGEHGSKEELKAKLIDPLVINFDSPSADYTDRSFEFDLDCDGELDNIALLGQACGYLAYDKNEDGQINDGSELFGAKSGDGFMELSVYDSDGNGWIDEADPIFDKLKIWSKDEAGNDVLVGLGVRGVGAIYLGSVPTGFAIKDNENVTQGIIRSTGVFLREDGSAGTVQQVDLADRRKAV